jgi:hypothetical protein
MYISREPYFPIPNAAARANLKNSRAQAQQLNTKGQGGIPIPQTSVRPAVAYATYKVMICILLLWLHLCIVHLSTSLIFWLICAFTVYVLNFIALVYWLYYGIFLQYVALDRPIYKNSTGTWWVRCPTSASLSVKFNPTIIFSGSDFQSADLNPTHCHPYSGSVPLLHTVLGPTCRTLGGGSKRSLDSLAHMLKTYPGALSQEREKITAWTGRLREDVFYKAVYYIEKSSIDKYNDLKCIILSFLSW